MEEMRNPFLEDSKDLFKLDTRDIAVASSICQVAEKGNEHFREFVTKWLIEGSISLTEPIKKNKLQLFSRPPPRKKSKASLQVSSLKYDVSLFSRLYIACHASHEVETLMTFFAMRTRHVLLCYLILAC